MQDTMKLMKVKFVFEEKTHWIMAVHVILRMVMLRNGHTRTNFCLNPQSKLVEDISLSLAETKILQLHAVYWEKQKIPKTFKPKKIS